MASLFKELNNQFIKRPALTLFRKPFVNNDEMSNILEGMLDMYASVEQETITKRKALKYKAIYWCHADYSPIKEEYGQVVTFHRYPKINKDFYTIITHSDSEIQEARNTYLDREFIKSVVLYDTNDSALKKQIEEEEAYKLSKRTYDLWILDPRLDILESIEKTATQGINVSKTYTPYVTGLFEKIVKNESKFVNTEAGAKLLKELVNAGVKREDIKFYTLTLYEDTRVEKLSENNIKSRIKFFKSTQGGKEFLSWKKYCDQVRDFLNNKYKDVLSKSIMDYEPLKNFFYNVSSSVEGFSVSSSYYKIDIQNNFFNCDEIQKKYSKFLSDNNVTPYLKKGTIVFSSYPTSKGVYSKETANGAKQDFAYKYLSIKEGSYISFDFKPTDLTVSDLIEIYCVIASSSGYKYFENSVSNITHTGYDSPLRVGNTDYVGVSTSSTLNIWSSSSFSDMSILLSALQKVSGIKAMISEEAILRINLKKNLTHGAIPSILDFKVEYYSKIFKQYIKPRCEKYQDFVDSGLMKAYPYNILEQGNLLLSLQEEDASNISTSSFSVGSDSTSLSRSELKLDIINYFEDVLFNNISGFYTTSTTPISETVSPFSNTYISEENLPSNNLNVQAANILSALSSYSSTDSTYQNINNVSNKDVSSISLSRQAKGKSSASILIKNLNNKYSFTSDFYEGDSIFEPMDEVFVYLPTFDEKLTLSFKGYINSVESVNDKGYNSIGLQLSCPMKKLEVTRTNIKPSLSSAENNNSSVHPFTIPEHFYDSIEYWAPFMFMQAFTFYSSMLAKSTLADANTYIYEVDPDTQLPIFKDPLLKYMWYRQTNSPSTQSVASQAFIELTNLYTRYSKYEDGSLISSVQTFDGAIPTTQTTQEYKDNKVQSQYDIYRSTNGDKRFKVNYDIMAQRSDGYVKDSRNITAQILGTLQPAWVIGASDIPVVFSTYRTNLDILTETADKFNCYLYSDRNGVVQFRPPQISLQNLNCNTPKYMSTFDVSNVIETKDYSYSLRPDIISNQTCSSYHIQCNDSELVTWLQLTGQNIWGGLNAESGNAVVIQDLPKSLKYGIKAQQAQVLSGVDKKEALYIYGLCLLDRQNSLFRSGNASGIASGDLDVNTTVYSPIDNTVFLTDGLTIKYEPGKTMTYNIPLKWGRKPLFKIPFIQTSLDTYSLSSIKSSLSTAKQQVFDAWTGKTTNIEDTSLLKYINMYELREKLKECAKEHQITDAYYNQIISYLDYIETHSQAEYFLSTFMFNGYVWDGINSISFEDILLSYFGSLLAENAGLELALGVNSRWTDEKGISNLRKSLTKTEQKTLESFSSVFRVVIPNGSSVEKQINIYVNKPSFST